MTLEHALEGRAHVASAPGPAARPALDLANWPGADRRSPGLSHPARLTLLPLSRALSRAVARDVAPGGADQAVLDVGCGVKPYLPFFAPFAREYVGLDLRPGPHVDVTSPAESLPFGEGRFDAVLCTQTLEHVLEPAKVVAEMHRVLRPGGVALLSAPATAAYHPEPSDLWRWTQEGFVKVFRDNGDWSELDLQAAGGTAACFGYLLGVYIGAALDEPLLTPLRRTLLALNNAVFGALDRVVPLNYPRTYTLISNFLVVARKRP